MNNHYDILIIGAGLVGSSLALALSALPLRIAVSETLPLKTHATFDHDGRSLALTYGSSRILQAIGAWPELVAHVTPIHAVHISDRGHFGKTRIEAKQENVSALGYVIPAPVLGVALNNKLLQITASNHVTLFNPAKVVALQKNEKGFVVTLQNAEGETHITANLVVAADGTHSSVRELQNISTQTHDYGQSALATTVALSQAHNQVAYERFIESGALALLPLPGLRSALIWTGITEQIAELQTLSDAEFLQRAQLTFGHRLGRLLTVSKRHVYPLKMLYAEEQVKPGLVLLGNAAHTVHPIAAQGFNLGLGDVALLAQTIADAVRRGKDFANLKGLEKYATTRASQQKQTMQFTDSLTHIFAHDFLPLNLARNSALLALDFIPPLKHNLARRLMGVDGHLANLVRGLPLE